MTEAIIDYALFLAVFGTVLAVVAGAVAAIWNAIRNRGRK